jgi:hypothetical protein
LSLACFTRAVLSAKNKILFAQLALVKTSTKDAAVLVLPVPVAITKSAPLKWASIRLATAFMASIW